MTVAEARSTRPQRVRRPKQLKLRGAISTCILAARQRGGGSPARAGIQIGPTMQTIRSAALLGALLAVSAGCKSDSSNELFSASLWNPFDFKPLFAVDQEPIRIAVVSDDQSVWDVRAWWDLRDKTPWMEFCSALAGYARRPVQVVQLKPFQVAAQMTSGRLDFAMLSAAQLEEMRADADVANVIAYADAQDRTGLVVASAKSDITSVADIADQRFAFGPRGDPVLHYGAAKLLDDAGVPLERIQRELVPIAALQYHISSFEAAKEIVYGLTPVGVILRSEYDRYPDTGGQLIPTSFSKDQLRVLGETAPVNFGPFVAASAANPDLVESVRMFLITAAAKRPQVTDSLGIAAFNGVDDTGHKTP